MRLEEIEKLPRGQRWNAVHETVLAYIAARPDEDAARVTAAMRDAGYSALADAHENLRWEASFDRRKLRPPSA
jgi:hypothetical protein